MHVLFRLQFDFRKLSILLTASLLIELTFFWVKWALFSINLIIIRSIERKRKILRESWSKNFGTSQCLSACVICLQVKQTWVNYLHDKLPDDLRFRILRKLGNIEKCWIWAERHSLVSSLPFINWTLAIAVK